MRVVGEGVPGRGSILQEGQEGVGRCVWHRELV